MIRGLLEKIMNKIIFVSEDKRKIKDLKFRTGHLLVLSFILISLIAYASFEVAKSITEEESSHEIAKLMQKNDALNEELLKISSKIEYLKDVTAQIQKIDDQLRVESNLPEVDNNIRKLGVGGSGIEYYLNDNITEKQKEVIQSQKISIDELERQLEFELSSYESLLSHIKVVEDSLRHLPLMIPIPEEVYRLTDQFGRRMHPVLGVMKNHQGIDLGCKTGTPVYATADGYVRRAGPNGGYGNYIQIIHKNKVKKYGFETRYAHLSVIHVKKGEYVKRGDLIGEVGSTGRSTAPHLHYEVRYKGRPFDPQEYYFLTLR